MDALITVVVVAAVVLALAVVVAVTVGLVRRRRTRDLQADFAAAYDREFDRSTAAFSEPAEVERAATGERDDETSAPGSPPS